MATFTADTLENRTAAGPSAVFTYRRTGPRGGVPLVQLMRFRGTIDWWDPEFVDRLAADRDVILFDNVGIGYTGGEPRDTSEGFADGAIEFIETLGLTQVDLLGWSLGGIVAQHVALRRPGLVRKIVVAGSSGPGVVPPGSCTWPRSPSASKAAVQRSRSKPPRVSSPPWGGSWPWNGTS